MAEVIGLAASAAGLLSLGLQVYDGIASYINNFNDRGSDISALSTRAESLRTSITELRQILPRIAAKHSVGGTAAIPALKAADTELRALKSFLDELQGPPAQSNSMGATIREQKKKLAYPFRRPTLEKLEKRLEFANSALRTGIQSLGLLVIDLIDTSVSGISQKVDRSNATILGIESKSESLETSLSSVAASLIPIRDTSSAIKNSLDTFMTRTNVALTGVHEPLRVTLPELRDGMTNVSQQLRIVEDGVHTTTTSMFSGFRDSNHQMNELMNMVSRSTTQSVESASSISRDFAKVQQQLSEIGRILGANEPSTAFTYSSVALNRLASKPSVLKDACDSFQQITANQAGRSTLFEQRPHQQSSDLLLGSHRSCCCKKKTVAQQQATRFADFYWSNETITSQRHHPGCTFAQQSTIRTENARRAVFTGLRGLLSVALELSISWRSGAGGFSISPSITIQQMVDEERSPVFRVMMLMRSSVMRSSVHRFWKKGPHTEEKGILLENALRHAAAAIIELYHTNVCSVYDTNVSGQSALHQWTAVLADWSTYPIAISSINAMLQSGLPAGLLDYSGMSASDVLLCHVGIPDHFLHLLSPVFDSLPSANHNVMMFPHEWTVFSLSRIWGDLLDKYPSISKVFGFGSLSEAIVTGNKERVLTLLARKDCDLDEKNIFRQTIFHLAISAQQPDLLRLIVQAALTTGGSQRFDTPDINGKTALDFAAHYSGKICRNKKLPEPCIDRSCWIPFAVLQPHGWQLSPVNFWRPNNLFKTSSYSCVLQLIKIIKSSRNEFQAGGHHSLASYVVQSFVQRGKVLPQMSTNIDSLSRGFIYHDIAKDCRRSPGYPLWLVDLLFQNGINDVDCKDSFGATPLMVANREFGICQPAFTLWLLDHGADPLVNWPTGNRRSAENPRLKAAHMLLHFRDDYLCKKPNFMCLREIALRIAPLELLDGCQCGCIQRGGCGTTKLFFREMWSRFSNGLHFIFKRKPQQRQPHSELFDAEPLSERNTCDRKDSKESEMPPFLDDDILEMGEFDRRTPLPSMPILVGRLSEFLRHLAVDFSQWDHVSIAALRFLTFEALGMRHTCCCMPRPPQYSPDEIVELQDEDRPLLAFLDKLIAEFTEELRNSGDSLAKFLCRYWVGRIDEVLDELNAAGMTEEEIKVAEDMGIKWESPDTEWESPDTEWESSATESEIGLQPHLSLAEEIGILERKIDEILLESVTASRP